MINHTDDLNPAQLAVVENADGPCLVLAGAGSGKTRTITHRVAYLLERGVTRDEILLVTFTNKAAREMKQRVELLLGDQASLSWSGTFHHIAFRVLHRWASLLGYKNNFTILDSEDSHDLIKLCLRQEVVDSQAKRFPSSKVIQALFSYRQNAQIPLETVLAAKYPKWADLTTTMQTISDAYAKKKREANAMDFDDLLVNLATLLYRSEKVRHLYSEQFKYVLVDEYQDTNKIQAIIIRLFASCHKNVLVVGDDAQSIYSFRAATIENILDFEKHYPGAKVFRLETNYRSTPDILRVANQIIARNEKQYEKELQSVLVDGVKPSVHPFVDQTAEAEHIAERILSLRDEGLALDEMAVLFRAAFHSQALEVELVKRDIPYEYRGGVRFFERAHIKDVLAYLRLFHNADDTIAWSRALRLESGMGAVTTNSVIQMVRTDGGPDQVAGRLPARAQMGWDRFQKLYRAMIQSPDSSPAELIRLILTTKYREYLETTYEDARERVQDIEQLALYAERQPDLQKFLGEVSLQENFTLREAGRETEKEDEEKLVLSTVHQAKGLEWEAVFIINVANGQFPNERAASEPNGLEEERRLFYVAVTRAKKYLSISYSLLSGFGSSLAGPSLFLDEIDQDLLDHHHLVDPSATTVWTDPSDDVDTVDYVAENSGDWSGWGEKKRNFLRSVDEW